MASILEGAVINRGVMRYMSGIGCRCCMSLICTYRLSNSHLFRYTIYFSDLKLHYLTLSCLGICNLTLSYLKLSYLELPYLELSYLKLCYPKLWNVRTQDSILRKTLESEHSSYRNMQNRLEETHTSNPSVHGDENHHSA